jgi:YidC/Oxa1 family membrane protein insertase
MFDRTTWIALALSVAGLVGWQYYYSKTYAPYIAQQAALQKEAKLREATAKPTPVAVGKTPRTTMTPSAPVASPAPSATGALTPPVPELKPKRETLDTSRAEYLFASDTGGIESITLFLHLGANEHSLFLNQDSGLPIGALCNTEGKPLGGFAMEADKAKGSSRFTLVDPAGYSVTKTFTLPRTVGSPEEYLVTMELTFRNTGNSPVAIPAFTVAAGGAAPVHVRDLPTFTCFDWYREGKMTSVNAGWFDAGTIPLVGIQIRPARDLYGTEDRGIEWAAVTSQYFTTILTAPKGQPGSGVWARRYVDKEETDSADGHPVYGIAGGLGIAPVTLAPGESISRTYSIYAGPKDFYALNKLGGDQQKVMNFGMFHLVSEFLLWAMNSLQKVLHSYAAAIIILTILIKSALWPLQNKATASMKRMQLLSPKMTELREKYKDDPKKMNEELMKLYRQYGVNPFGGCLPMLIQIPIFFGFYSMLGSAIELRNSHFLWIHDLSQPDTLTHVLGFPVNLLPIIMAGTMVWQMAISPKSGDASQQRIMYFMPVIFLTFAYNYASGLALYWTTQNLFSIVQLYWTRNQPIPTLEKVSSKSKGGGGALPGRKR